MGDAARHAAVEAAAAAHSTSASKQQQQQAESHYFLFLCIVGALHKACLQPQLTGHEPAALADDSKLQQNQNRKRNTIVYLDKEKGFHEVYLRTDS